MMDKKGRCCGRKPIRYKRQGILFCSRCDREYSMATGEQVESFAWERVSGGWRKVATRRAVYASPGVVTESQCTEEKP